LIKDTNTFANGTNVTVFNRLDLICGPNVLGSGQVARTADHSPHALIIAEETDEVATSQAIVRDSEQCRLERDGSLWDPGEHKAGLSCLRGKYR